MDRLHVKFNTALTLYFYIYNTATYSGGAPTTGLGTGPTAKYSLDGGSWSSTGTTVTEVDGTNLPGVYKVACTDVVTDGDVCVMNCTYYADKADPVTLYTDKTAANLRKTVPSTAFEAKIDVIDGIVDSILVDTGTTLDGKLDTIDNFLDTEVAAILTDTGTTLNDKIDVIDGIVDQILVDTGTTLDGKLDTIDNFLDTEVAAILTDTGTTLNDKLDVIDGIVDAILVDTGTTLDGKINTIDTIVDAILVDTGTTIPAATINANILSIWGSAAAATNLGSSGASMQLGVVHNSTAPAASTFLSDSAGLSSVDDVYNKRLLIMTSGTLAGAVAEIADYTGSTKTFVFTSPLPSAPANNDDFIIV